MHLTFSFNKGGALVTYAGTSCIFKAPPLLKEKVRCMALHFIYILEIGVNDMFTCLTSDHQIIDRKFKLVKSY
jgi:hypothetical protein